MKTIGDLLPLASFAVMVIGGFYALMLLKVSIVSFSEKLERIATLAEDHEHRLTVIETTDAVKNALAQSSLKG